MTQDTEIYLRDDDIELLKEVESVVSRSLVAGDIRMAMDFARNLRRGQQIQGLALAKLLFELDVRWEEFSTGGLEGDFFDVVQSELGVAPATSKKYVRLWEVLFISGRVPVQYQSMLLNKPIRGLLLLPAAVEDGNLDWNKIEVATTVGEIREVVREARGLQTSANNSLLITYEVRDGSLWAQVGNEFPKPVGKLYKDDGSDVVVRAIERILKSANVLEK